MLGLSLVMSVGLMIGVFIYHNQITDPTLDQFSSIRENTNRGNEPEQEQPQSQSLQPVNEDRISYTLQNDELSVTYNSGEDFAKVPIEVDLLFEGEYNGNKMELVDGSYILTEDRAMFLYSEGEDPEAKAIKLKYSLDQGDTWQDSVVTDTFSSPRFRKVDFINDQFGYVIVSGYRTMSQEYSTVFLTHDGGENWEETSDIGTTRLISDGGFIDESTGFLSYGTINPEEPDFYVTQDGGQTWEEAVFNIPGKYDKIFVQAEVPEKEEDHLSVLVNQGPNGDYEGGQVKGKFISEDNGNTWEFATEVQPDETN